MFSGCAAGVRPCHHRNHSDKTHERIHHSLSRDLFTQNSRSEEQQDRWCEASDQRCIGDCGVLKGSESQHDGEREENAWLPRHRDVMTSESISCDMGKREQHRQPDELSIQHDGG